MRLTRNLATCACFRYMARSERLKQEIKIGEGFNVEVAKHATDSKLGVIQKLAHVRYHTHWRVHKVPTPKNPEKTISLVWRT